MRWILGLPMTMVFAYEVIHDCTCCLSVLDGLAVPKGADYNVSFMYISFLIVIITVYMCIFNYFVIYILQLLLMPILDGRAFLYSFISPPEVRIGVAFGSGGSQSLPATELPGVSSWLVCLFTIYKVNHVSITLLVSSSGSNYNRDTGRLNKDLRKLIPPSVSAKFPVSHI